MTADRLRLLRDRWSVVPDGPPVRTPTSRLLFGSRHGEPVVLKVALDAEERRGGRLLAWWAGRGAVEVLRAEGDALLMRRATGLRDLGTWARTGRDAEATAVLAATASRLHGNGLPPPEVELVPLRAWFGALLDCTQGDPLLVRCARVADRAFAATGDEDVVTLHGDLHHGNVLDTGSAWAAIDPKALVGHRGFDLANLLLNPDEASALGHLRGRIDLLTRLSGLDRPTVVDWAVAWCGLSLAWGDPGAPTWHDRAARGVATRLLSDGCGVGHPLYPRRVTDDKAYEPPFSRDRPEVDALEQADGTHMVEPEFQEVRGRAEMLHDGSSRYVPIDAADEALTPRQEIESLLRSDKGRLGDVFVRPHMDPDAVAADLNVASVAFVYNMRRVIDALLDGRPVEGPVFRKQVLGTFQTQIARGRGVLSASAAELLVKNRAAVAAAGADEDPIEAAVEAEEEGRHAATTLADLEGVPGIYAFSYGWYLESPVDAERGNTLIKVGMSTNVAQRVRQHTSAARTHIPEPLALIRVYGAGDRRADKVERAFHTLLHTAGHDNPRRTGREVGQEWFLTNEDFLDAIADTLELQTVYTGRSEFAPE